MKKIIINTKQKIYPVYIGNSFLESCNSLFDKYLLFKNIFIVVDKNVFNIHKDYILKSLKPTTKKLNFLKINSGEKTKSFQVLPSIFSELVKKKYGRDTLLIAIGGGVTGDVAGFAASVYMRGVQLVHIPTTIIGSIDSAVGGKTGVNFNKYKNLIGTFYQPEMVLIDTDFLQSLPEEEINSGIGELIKYGYLTNINFYKYLEENIQKIYSLDKRVLKRIINESVLFKGSVIEKDETENELRKILNFGHTFAHAFESKSDLKLKHGEAVAAGIISALFLSYKKGFLSQKKLEELLKLPLKIRLPAGFNKDYAKLIKFMHGDKKNRGEEIQFILLTDIGKLISGISANKNDIYYSLDNTARILER